jgi:Tol biopolymer transport system component
MMSWNPLGPNKFPSGGRVTALSTRPTESSLYVVGLDDQVWTRYFPNSSHLDKWSDWLPLGPNVFPKGASVAALSTRLGQTSLYILGLDGQVWTKYFPDNSHPGQWSGWLPLGPDIFPAGGTITALSARPGETSLYILGLDGQVWTNYFPDNSHPGQWSGWLPLGPNVFPAGATITALSARPGETSLYILGLDGQVWTLFFFDLGSLKSKS